MTKIIKEAEKYKNLSERKLKRVILNYKLLSKSNSKNFNFMITLLSLLIPYLIFIDINFTSMSFLLLIHYLFFHKFLFEKRKRKLVSDEEKEEIDQIIVILESYLKDKQRKTPSI